MVTSMHKNHKIIRLFSLISVRLAILSLLVSVNIFAAQAIAREVVIATLSDGPQAREFVLLTTVKQEIKAIVGDEFDVSFPASLAVDADWTVEGIQSQLDALLNNEQVDIILTMGIVGSHLAAHTENLSKPIVAPIVVDVALQQMPYHNNTSGKDNYVYMRFVNSVSDDLTRFQDLVQYKHLGILVDELPVAAIPGLSRTVDKAAQDFGFKITLIKGKQNIREMAAKIPDSVDAVMLAPLLRVNDDNIRELADYLIERELPSYSFLGQRELELGLMATVAGRADDEVIFARRVATNVYRILLGTPASELNVDFYESDRLSINMSTARAIGVSPRWVELEDAELLYDDVVSNAKVLTLSEAMARALEANVDLQASQVNITISENDIGIARSSLLPQLNANTSYESIDKDRANPQGFAENSGDAGIQASQTIYSDDQWANLTISKHLSSSTSLETKITMLDTLQSSATAYLNVLRTIALEQVQKSNVELTRDNLELAKSRVQIGESSRADVLRWKSQIARDRQSLLAAEADRLISETELYRVLHLPISEPIATSDESIQQVLAELNRSENRDLYDNPLAWEKFIVFQSDVAKENAPEVKRFDYLIKAQNRQVTADRRAYYVPDVSLTSSLTENVSRSGAGSNLNGTGIHDDQWSIGVQATLPIFTSGQLKSQLSKSRNTHRQLLLQKEAEQERVETRMRSALYNAAASHSSIRLAMDAAAAANENLELVTDSYSEGAVSITDLIDAQDAALAAQLQAADARYAFLINLVDVLRAESNFDLLLQQDGIKLWQQRVRATMQ